MSRGARGIVFGEGVGGGVVSREVGGSEEVVAVEGASDDDEDELDWGRSEWEGSVPVMPPVLTTLGLSPPRWWWFIAAGFPSLLAL